MDIAVIEGALQHAAGELAHIAEMQPRERIFQEAQLQCALYGYFHNHDMHVHAEAGYGGNQQQKCDLVVDPPPPCPRTWVELKIASHHRNPGNAHILHNKAAEFRGRWQRDVGRLLELEADACKVFILLGLFDFNPNDEQGCALLNHINAFCLQNHQNPVLEYAMHHLAWPNMVGALHGKFWVWQWH